MDITEYRKDFPIFSVMEQENPKWVYLDSGATTQKPRQVIDAITESYTHCNANVHRGVYKMSRQATERHEAARHTVAQFIGAASDKEVLFTRGTTEAINLVAHSYGEAFVKEGDEIVITTMEHHANIVPWQMLCQKKGCKLKVAQLLPDGSLDLEHFKSLLSDKTRLVAVAHVSNVLGTHNPIEMLSQWTHEVGAHLLVDGAQAIAHTNVDVQKLGVDFYAFSGHKIYAPTGIGVLWGRQELLDQMPPYQTGGEMIDRVSFEETTFNTLPHKFEAGTPDFIGSHALATALLYVQSIGIDRIATYENELLCHATEIVQSFPELTILGTAPHKSGAVTMVCNKAHAYDLGMLLDQQGIAVRTGHHCAQPLVESLGQTATLRLSLALYNNHSDLDKFASAMKRALSFF